MVKQIGKRVYEFPDNQEQGIMEIWDAVTSVYVEFTQNIKFEEVCNASKSIKLKRYIPPESYQMITNNL